ncbi:hypothetical protein [Streptomyces mirabilis]|uniref:hypothetical protein n=1 Tax=Streptomyces mirabilis TaxID=68239 RepID=UPI0036A24257
MKFRCHRPATRISKTDNAQLGDIVFFKWKKERRYNHTTLDDVLARYRGTSNPIQRVLIIRPRSAK